MLQCTNRAALALLAGLTACAGPRSAAVEPLQEPFRVLLLGDSISIGYTPHVQRLLAGRAEVVRPMRPNGTSPENCAGTNHGVERIDAWLALDGGGWDVVHFNFGLHDLKRVDPETGKNSNDPAHPHQASPERYRRQLERIARAIQATGARPIFATTTPVPKGDLRPHREPADAVVYNAIAVEVMVELGIPIDDLFAYCAPRLGELQRPANVHFTPEGSLALADQVVSAVLAAAGLERSAGG